MPIYHYYCGECGETTQKIVKMEVRDKQVCECGGPLARKITAPGLVWSPTRNGGMST